ncbi:M23 family metallopeptidase [Flexivirga oryzae]|uniref:Murein DD-endopeptidase MepM/ murein hydrolase activator NlpD n=1 Tax=Flexivirga oryzae TaxID=1794944 RepID=A0A839NCG8_9MICO|nr:peptidoglycan DD-metalloendopeptidase family protein [Flexivirga oryzae]MBB2892401.1 murein DD-endopeptidase MepM/ murein hydrolase activator NlpD [Flexivirga oryzae]
MSNVWRAVAAFVAAAGAALGGGSAAPPVSLDPTPADGFRWPLHPKPQVLRPFEAPPQPWAAGHRGADLAGSVGQPVLAAGAGTVSFSGVIAGRGVIAVQHAGGRRTTYEPVTDRDPTGTVEAAGDRIATLAAGDHCGDRPCLHWGLLVGPNNYRDPLSLLEFRPVRLLPLG